MIADTLLALALALPPRPSLDRVPVLRPLPPAPVVALATREEERPAFLTTCHENKSGSCWTEE